MVICLKQQFVSCQLKWRFIFWGNTWSRSNYHQMFDGFRSTYSFDLFQVVVKLLLKCKNVPSVQETGDSGDSDSAENVFCIMLEHHIESYGMREAVFHTVDVSDVVPVPLLKVDRTIFGSIIAVAPSVPTDGTDGIAYGVTFALSTCLVPTNFDSVLPLVWNKQTSPLWMTCQ